MGTSSLGLVIGDLINSVALPVGSTLVEWNTHAAIRPRILEVAILSQTAAAFPMFFGRPKAAGIAPVNASFIPDDPADPPSVMRGATSWGGTSPILPDVAHRAWITCNTGTGGVIWTFPRGFILPQGGSAIVWTNTAFGILNNQVSFNCVVDE